MNTPEMHQPDFVPRVVGEDEAKERARLLKLWRQVDAIYMSREWYRTQHDIIDYIQPNHGQFHQTDTNVGTRKDVRVLNNIASDKSRKLGAAIDVGVCSEAREWWVAGTEDPRDMEDQGNREYCHQFQEAMFSGIAKIGWYAANRAAIDDNCGPATGVVLIEEDEKDTARCTHLPVGRYRVWTNAKGEVNGLADVFTLTAAQMDEEFGAENCSPAVRLALTNDLTQGAYFTVLHIIEERPGHLREHGKIDAKNMPWASHWLELGQGYAGTLVPGQSDQAAGTGPTGILRESGYHEQPFYCYRWHVVGQNAYGTDSPGWTSLGDVRQLQDMEMGGAELVALLMKPPMNRPAGLADGSIAPGADNPLPDNTRVKFEPSYVPEPEAVKVTDAKIVRLEQRITNDHFGDILFILSGNPQPEPKTAEEIRGIKEERLLQLGGVFARMSDQLRVALRRMAGIFHRANMLPKPPDKLLQNGRIKIDFVNPLITAMKAIGFTGIQQLINLCVQLGEAKKAGDDKLDGDKIKAVGADMLGVNPDLLFSDEELQQNRAAAADQANAEKQGAAMPEAAGALKDLSNTDPEKLRSLLSTFGPAAAAQGSTAGA